MSIGGQWEGKLIDVTGVSAVVKLALKEGRGRVEGDFAVYFVSQSDGACCQPDRRLAQTGPVVGRYDSKNNQLHFDYTLSVGLHPVNVRFDAAVREAYPHAKQSIFGCYQVAADEADLTLEGGGIVLWQYQ